MIKTIGQRWSVQSYGDSAIRALVPKEGEMVCVNDTPDHGDSVIGLMGNGTSTVERLYEKRGRPESISVDMNHIFVNNADLTLPAIGRTGDLAVYTFDFRVSDTRRVIRLPADGNHTATITGVMAYTQGGGYDGVASSFKDSFSDAVSGVNSILFTGLVDRSAAYKATGQITMRRNA